MRAARQLNLPAIPARNRADARNTVFKTYSSPISFASLPSLNLSAACFSRSSDRAASADTYCGMYSGPGGADALLSGSVAIQASNAGRNSGRNRRSYRAASAASPVWSALSH